VAIRITAVHIQEGDTDVTELEWVSIEHRNEGCSTRDAMIDWLESDPRNIALVGRGPKATPVRVVREGDGIRLAALVDGSAADKLLQLPQY
jgi:hypothetical protein